LLLELISLAGDSTALLYDLINYDFRFSSHSSHTSTRYPLRSLGEMVRFSRGRNKFFLMSLMAASRLSSF